MSDAEADDLPLEASLGLAGSHATETFALLGNETRLAILLALWDAYDPHASDNVVSFSELFDRVEYADPGNFSYHLDQLSGQFIARRDGGDGYELRTPALRFIHAVIAGAGVQDATLEPTEIERPCPFCDAPTVLSYQEGLVVHRCTRCEGVTDEETPPGYLNAVPFDPAGLENRSPEELRAASRVAAWRQTQLMFDGLCPACSGRVEGRLECCPAHDPDGLCARCGMRFAVVARFECRTCKNHNVSSPKALALFHPAVVSFYDAHGVSTRVRADEIGSVRRAFDLMDDHEVTVVSEEPPEVTVLVSHDGDERRVTFDESVRVVDVRP